uniref:GK20559 n=1 Tax=Drosophila willistoni TaxID=7260 RepID=B4N5E5_DROWI
MAAANDGSLEFVNSNSSGNNSNTSSSNSNASSCNSNSSATVNNNSSNSSNSSNNNGGSNNNNSSNINNNNNSHHSNHGQNNMNSYVTAAAAAQAAAAQAAAAAAAASAQQQQQQQQQHQQQQQQQHQHQHQHQQSAMDPRYGCRLTLPLPLPPPLGPPPRSLEHMIIYENFDVHETHRIEDGVCTHISRLPPKKQELLKQFGIQSSQQCLSNYEKYILIENFIKFCNEYQISDHRPFLDFHESALSKCEQLKFVRYLGQGLSNLTLNKIYVAFKDLMSHGRTEKSGLDNYNLDALLKKKRKNLYNRLHAAAPSIDITAYETAQHPHTRPLHAFAALNAGTQQQQHQQQQQRSEVCNDLAAQYSYAPQQR